MPARISNALQATLRRAHDAMQEAGAAGMSPETFTDAVRAAEISAFMDGERVTFQPPLPPLPPEHAFADTFTESEVPEPVAVTQIPLIEEDAVVPPHFQRLDISSIIPPNPPGNPTTAFVENVRQLGVLQPIIVREVRPGAGVAHTYEVIAGTRRLAAAQACGMATIRACVYPISTPNRLVSAAALSENLQRASNIARDVDMIEMLVRGGESVERTRERLHLSPGQMSSRAALLNLTPEWRTIFRERRTALTTATRIAAMSRTSQRRLWGILTNNGAAPGRVTSAMVETALGPQPTIREVNAEIFADVPDLHLHDDSREYAARVMAQGMVAVLARETTPATLDRAVRRGTAGVEAFMGRVVPDDYVVSIVNAGTRASLDEPVIVSNLPQAYERVGNGRVPIGNPQPIDDDDATPILTVAHGASGGTVVMVTESWASVIALLEQAEQAIPVDGEEITDDFAARLNRLLTDANEGRRTGEPVIAPGTAALALEAQNLAAIRRGRSVRRSNSR